MCMLQMFSEEGNEVVRPDEYMQYVYGYGVKH